MRGVKAAAALAALAALGWCGWWFAAAAGQEEALERWLEARAADGWLAEVAAIEIDGFPTRFERRLERPALADPAAGWAWRAPFLELGSDAWDPTDVAIRFPGEQTLSLAGARAAVRAERFTGRAAVVPSAALAVRRLGLEADALVIEGAAGWRAGADRVAAALDRLADDVAPAHAYAVDLEARGVRLPGPVGAAFEAEEGAEATLALSGRIVADRALDRTVLDTGEIGGRVVRVEAARLAYGAIAFEASGRLEADAEGFAEGSLDVAARQWRRALDGLVASGTVSEGAAAAVRQALRVVTLFSGDDDRLDVTLTFSGGRVRLGPVPLGAAPRLLPPR